jgi:hypothetical protein
MTHPVDDTSGESPNFFTVVDDEPLDRLKIVAGRSVTGYVDQLCENVPLNFLLLVGPNRPAAPEEMRDLFNP